MSIVDRYLAKEIMRHFAVVLAMVVCIYMAVDFFENIDAFMAKNVPFSTIATFFLNKIPFVIAQITPLGILLAVLIAFGLMSKNNEIIALKSSGISIYSLVRPLLGIGMLASLFLFFLAEVIVPVTMDTVNRIWIEDVRNEKVVISREKDIWIKGKRSIMHIKYYNPKEKAIYGITVNHFDDHFNLVKRIDAQKGVFQERTWLMREKEMAPDSARSFKVFQGPTWLLQEIMEQTLDKRSGQYQVTLKKRKIENLKFIPDDLKQVIKKSEEMNFKELLEYIRKVEAEGYDATGYRVDLYGKTALPFVCIIMVLVGTGIGVREKVKEGLPISVTYGIGIAFLYWVFYSFCVSLGYGEMLPPFIAAWTANLLFLCVGTILLLNAE